MKQTARARSHVKVKGARMMNVGNSVPKPRSGTLVKPPDNSGTVQIPKPLVVRQQVVKRTFKQDFTLATTSTGGITFQASLYNPFTITNNSTVNPSIPSSLTSFYNVFGLYKPKRIQLIFEPLAASTAVPIPYTVGMVISPPSGSSIPAGPLIDYQNSTKVHPLYPTELSYIIPPLAAASSSFFVLKGGWIQSNSNITLATGFVEALQPATPVVASTTYTLMTVLYEVWFKQPI